MVSQLALAATAALLSFALAPSARACSVDSDYVRPSNFELVQIADAIVVATAVRGLEEDDDSMVDFRIDTNLKGAGPQTFRSDSARLGATHASDLNDLSASHPEGHAGPCNRYTFRKGGRYLLFLSRDKGGEWRTLGYPFSRISEDYSEQSVWARTVRRYIGIQEQLGPIEEVESLAGMLESKRGPGGETLADAELADIRDHLSSLSPWKPTPFLLAALERLEGGRSPTFGVRSAAANGEIGPAADLTDLLLGDSKPDLDSLAARKRFLLNALVEGDHPTALPLFETFLSAPAFDSDRFGFALRFLAKHGQYRRAYEWIEKELPRVLPTLSLEAGSRLLGHVSQVQRGDWSVETPRWKSDPHSAGTWPELALSIYWSQAERFGRERAARFDDAISAIPIDDFRKRPELALALAPGFNSKVADWARAELGRLHRGSASRNESEPGSDDPARLPLQVLLAAWRSDSVPLFEAAFCHDERSRHLLIGLIGTDADSLFHTLFSRIAVTPSLTADERVLLVKAIEEMAAREARENNGFFSSHRQLIALRDQVKAGTGIKAKPIACR
jgi:hypothetical protein